MRFDFTSGKEARYIISVYSWNIEDHIYYHYYKEAKWYFDRLVEKGFEDGVVVSLYDLKNDKRKCFKKF